MGSIRKRGNSYHAQIRIKGWQSFTKTFPNKKLANQWIKKIEAQISVSTPRSKDQEALSLSDACARYISEISSTHKGYAAESARLRFLARGPLGSTDLKYLSQGQIHDYFSRRASKVAEGTLRREFLLLRRLLSIAITSWKLAVAVNPMTELSVPKDSPHRERRVTANEWASILNIASNLRNPLPKAVIEFAYETGMRRSEILKLRWDDVHNQTCNIRDSKNGLGRIIPLSKTAIAIIKELEACSENIFPISQNAIRLSWERIMAKTRIENLRFHDLRHEAISRFFELGMTIAEVRSISGHKDVRQLFRYTHLDAVAIGKKYFHAQ